MVYLYGDIRNYHSIRLERVPYSWIRIGAYSVFWYANIRDSYSRIRMERDSYFYVHPVFTRIHEYGFSVLSVYISHIPYSYTAFRIHIRILFSSGYFYQRNCIPLVFVYWWLFLLEYYSTVVSLGGHLKFSYEAKPKQSDENGVWMHCMLIHIYT